MAAASRIDAPAPSPRPLVAVPLKPFHTAKGRLSASLDPDARASLMRETAQRVVNAARLTGATVVVVTADPGVAAWAHQRGLDAIAEPPGSGLDGAAGAATHGAMAVGSAWCVVHGDLPLITSDLLSTALHFADEGVAVIAPSRNGGTNLIAGRGTIRFSYGPGSFTRHLAALGDRPRRIVVTAGTALDLDTPDDLAAAAALPGGSWLARYLG